MLSATAPRLRLARRHPARAVAYCTVDPGQTRSHQSPTKHLPPMPALVHPSRGHNNHNSSQIWPNRARCTSGGRSVRTPQPPLLTASSAHLLPCSPAWGRVVAPEPPAARSASRRRKICGRLSPLGRGVGRWRRQLGGDQRGLAVA
jgi:hypothetical protein